MMIPITQNPLPTFTANGQLIALAQPKFLLTATKGGVWLEHSQGPGPKTFTVSFLREGVMYPAGFASCQHKLETFGLN